MRLIQILAWTMTIFKSIVSNKDAVAYVENPVESGFPSHWLPVSIIKRIMENRVRTTDEDYYYPKVKLLLNYTRRPLFHVRRGTTTKQTPPIATVDIAVRNVTITKNVTTLPATLKATAGTFTTTKLETDKIEPTSLSQSENHTTTPKLLTNINTVVLTKPIAFSLTTELTINTPDSNYDHTTTSMQDNTTNASRLIQLPTLTPTESTTKKVLTTTKSMTTSTIEVPTTIEVTTTTTKAPTTTAKVTTTITTEEPTTAKKVSTKTSHVLATTTKETTATTTDIPKTTTEMLTTTTLLLTTTTIGTTATTESGNPFY